jgi:HlyD family secretion protein
MPPPAAESAAKPLFRQSALAERAAPDRLEELLPIAPPRALLSLAGFAIVLATLLVWSFRATVPTRAEGQAVVLRTGGVQGVAAPSAGIIVTLDAKPGDHVKANQVIARIAQPLLAERLRGAQSALDAARMEKDRAVSVRRQAAGLETASVERQKDSTTREIADLEGRAKLAAQQVPVEEELFAKGLVTRQQVITVRQKHADLLSSINRLKAQLARFDAQRFAIEAAPGQVAADNDARVREAERLLADLRQQLTMAEAVTAPYGGQVVEVKSYPGASISIGAPLLSLQPEAEELEVIAYVPSQHAKEIRPGLEVEISPTNVKREEFGFLKGNVRFVADYPATPAALMRNFENESLVKSLTSDGTITEVRVTLLRDVATPSGFRWSSAKGPAIRITPGTLAGIRIVTRQQTPISLVLPFLKAKAGW